MSNKLTPHHLLEIRVANSNRALKVHNAIKNSGWTLAYNVSLATGLVGAVAFASTSNSALLSAAAIGVGLSKLGPKVNSAFERMKISTNSDYYRNKVAEIGTAYANERLKHSSANYTTDESKQKGRQLICDFCESVGLDANGKFYRDCVRAGAQLVTATKMGSPEFLSKANTRIR